MDPLRARQEMIRREVPAAALFRHDEEWAGLVADHGRTVLRPVKVGRRNGSDAEILNGIKENEKVVIHPTDKLRDGISVREWRPPRAP